MRQRREEFVLHPVQFVGVPEQSRVLDCHRDAARELLDQLDVGGGVLAPRFLLRRAERHHADDAAAHAKRRADIRVGMQLFADRQQIAVETRPSRRDRALELGV